MWYLDCYCYGAACGRDFPVNSYFCESLEVLVTLANRVLASAQSGIDEVRLSRETKGQCPVRASFQERETP